MLMLLLAGASVALATFLVVDVVTLPARQRQGSIKRAAHYGRSRFIAGPLEDGNFRERTIDPMKTGLARAVIRISPGANIERTTTRLMSAGLGRRVSPTSFLASKALFGLGGFFGGQALAGWMGSLSSKSLFLSIGGALVAFMLPDVVVTFKTRSRKEILVSELPDALDLLAVSVEAGLGFDGAISKLTEHMEGPLAEEFGLTLGEMRIGESRQNALSKMMHRVATPELSAFVRAIIQADQLGISLGRILKVQAADTRSRRQLAAEERAMKAPIKMLFPTVLFIFPAMFIVILGPAFLNLADLF